MRGNYIARPQEIIFPDARMLKIRANKKEGTIGRYLLAYSDVKSRNSAIRGNTHLFSETLADWAVRRAVRFATVHLHHICQVMILSCIHM